MIACSSMSSSLTIHVPSVSLNDERTWMLDAVVTSVLDRAQREHARAARRELEHLLERDLRRSLRALGDDARVGGVDAVDVGVDLADVGVERRGERDRGRVGAAAAERRDVARRSRRPGSRRRSRSCPPRAPRARGRGASRRSAPCRALVSVTIPACEPVNETASWPRSLIAIETSAIEIRSPAVSSMSMLARVRVRRDLRARGRSARSVVSPIAETTAQTRVAGLGGLDDRAARRA